MTAQLPLPDLPKSSWLDDRVTYQKLAESIEPVAVVQTKDSWVWIALWVLGVVLSLGVFALGMPLRRFLEDFATTIVTRQGYARTWPKLSRALVAHESRHTTHAVWLGWWAFPITWISRRLRAWFGGLPYAVLYFVLPIPMGLAAGRFYLELDADRAAWRRGLREGWMSPEEVLARADRRGETLASGAYGWAWPGPLARRSYRRAARKITALRAAGAL